LFSLGFSQTHHSNEQHKHKQKRSLNQDHYFIENKGQWPDAVLFKSKIPAGNIWVHQHKLLFHLQDYSRLNELHQKPKDAEETIYGKQVLVHLNFPTSNTVTKIEKQQQTNTYFNFFIGNDKSKWANDVRGYSDVTMKEFYNGIDLKLISHPEEFKYEFHLQPNADPRLISFNYAGVKNVKLAKNGNLIIETELGKIFEQKPYTYQMVDGKIKEIKNAFVVNDNQVSFNLGKYDQSLKLIIDPVLVFATYSGSVTDNFGMTATYGYDGTAYSAGIIYGNQYPTPDPLAWDVSSNITIPSTNVATTDAFISKYSADGTTMLWTTFIGGGDNIQGTETAHSLICDQSNNIYMYGVTSSLDFPIQGGFQTVHNGGTTLSVAFNGTNFGTVGTDIFVAKFSANGQSLLGSTYIGGAANDGVNYKVTSGSYNSVAAYDSLSMNYGDQFRGEIMLDETGNCIVASCTRSLNFPVLNAFQSSNAGQLDGVVFKMSPNLTNLIWSSYYGGSNNDACYSVKVDSSSNVVIAGGTSSIDLPFTSGGFNPTYNGGKTDGFVAKINSTGVSILNATYLGTTNYDQAFFVEIDRNDNVFILGQSIGGTFPVLNANFVNPGSSQFIIKLNPELNQNLNSTVFGNGNPSINISPAAFLVDICGNMYVSGWGANILQGVPLSGMPITQDAFQQTAPNGFDFYLLVIKRNFEDTLYASYIGGASASEHVDGGTSRFDKNGVVYQSVCGGCGGFSDFPTTPGAWSSQNLSSNCNNLIFKFDFQLIPVADFIPDQTVGCANFTVQFENFSSEEDSYLWDFGNGILDSTTFEPSITFSEPGNYLVNLYVTDSVCLLTDTAQISITVNPLVVLNLDSIAYICSSSPTTIIADSDGTASEFVWSNSPSFLNPLNSPSDSLIQVVNPGMYYVKASNTFCSKIDSIYIEDITPQIDLIINSSSGCAPLTVTVKANTINADTLLWGFGQVFSYGTTVIDNIQNYTFTNPGSYFVNVFTGNSICPNFIYDNILITVYPPPQLELSFNTLTGCSPTSIAVEATALNTDSLNWNFTPISSYSTTFDQNEQIFIFDTAGIFNVSVSATSTLCPNPIIVDTIIEIIPPVVLNSFSPILVCDNSPQTLTASVSGNPDTIIWSFMSDLSSPINDNTSDVDIVVYNSGTYFVGVSNPYCADLDSVEVLFNAPPQASFSLDNYNGCVPFTVNINNTSVQSENFIWTFGNGQVDSLNFSPSVTYTSAGTYTINLIFNDSICQINDTVIANVVIFDFPSIQLDDSTIVCSQDSLLLNGMPNQTDYNYLWSSTSQFTDTLNFNNSPSIYVDSTGNYYFSINNSGCLTQDSVFVEFRLPPDVNFSISDTIGCEPLSVTFSNYSASNFNSEWNFNGTILTTNDSIINFDFQTAGTYPISLTVTDTFCSFQNTNNAFITIIPNVGVDLIDSLNYCDSSQVFITGNSNGSASSFVWSSNSAFTDTLNSNILDSTLLLNYPNYSEYYFYATNGYCFASDSIIINYEELSVDLFAPDSVCYNDLIEVIATISPPYDDFIYNWSSQYFNIPTANDTLSYFLGMMQGSHTVYLTVERENCTAFDSTFINVSFMGDVVSATVSQSIVTPGSVVVLNALPNSYESYSWSPSDGVNFPNSPQTEATVNENTIFTVTAKEGACTLIDTVEVKVYEIICEDPYVFIPNAFSPNGDLENDVLYVRGIWIEKMIFRIFDRWGEMVFESTDPTIGWDGTFRGRKLDPDVYDFYLDVTCIGGLQSITKGNVTLMK
jgi:gliding motility-associated-like protein